MLFFLFFLIMRSLLPWFMEILNACNKDTVVKKKFSFLKRKKNPRYVILYFGFCIFICFLQLKRLLVLSKSNFIYTKAKIFQQFLVQIRNFFFFFVWIKEMLIFCIIALCFYRYYMLNTGRFFFFPCIFLLSMLLHIFMCESLFPL